MFTQSGFQRFLNFAIFIVAVNFSVISCQNLQAEYVQSKLPSGLRGAAVVFDNEDSIYIFGGDNDSGFPSADKIYRFGISDDTLEQVGNIPTKFSYGSGQLDNDGNIYLFGTTQGNHEILKFTPTTNQTNVIATIDYNLMLSSSVKYNSTSSVVYNFGGNGNFGQILEFDMQTDVTRPVGKLSRDCTFCSVVQFGTHAYFFHAKIEKLDLNTFESVDGTEDFPYESSYSSAVTDGKNAYVFGGYRNTSPTPTNGILKVDFENLTHTFLPVDNFIINSTHFLESPPSSVYVPKLNRIYLFGGRVTDGATWPISPRDIWYIQLE